MVLNFPIPADYSIFPVGNRLIYATHGHVYNTAHLPPLCPGDILLHGHTHVPAWEPFGENNLYAITAEDYYPWYVNQILVYPMRFDVSLLPDYLNRAAVRAMPVFPAEGSIQMIDGVLVVHIGRQQLGE